jgi:hypothetical protein
MQKRGTITATLERLDKVAHCNVVFGRSVAASCRDFS